MGRAARRGLAIVAGLALGALAAAPAVATTIPPGTVDMTAASAAEITFSNFSYSPNLLAVGRSGAARAGVTWSGTFSSHPLRFEDTSVAGNGDGPR
jgi:hypothetical protein